jgi:hypothetical protein
LNGYGEKVNKRANGGEREKMLDLRLRDYLWDGKKGIGDDGQIWDCVEC